MKKVEFNFEKLKVYQKALDFIESTYKIVEDFPKAETYGLSSQYKRSAVSIALNIAEGAGDSNAQFNRFLNIANGSVKECVVCSTIAKSLNYINDEKDEETRIKLEELSKMLSGLKKALKTNV